jgi:hypothetical protein
MDKNVKKSVARPRTVLLGIVVLGILYLCVLGVADLRNQMVFASTFDACAKHKPQDKNYQMYTDPASIPCYQQALKAGPDKGNESLFASLLVKQGRDDEARLVYEDVAHPNALDFLLHRTRTADANQMLAPGGFDKARVQMAHFDNVQHELQVVTTRNQQEEHDFLMQHAIVRHNQIMYMSEADKVVWNRMRRQHGDQQNALARL